MMAWDWACFIAKTLLERSGAVLTFANGGTKRRSRGAIVVVEWPRDQIEQATISGGLGDNQPFRPLTS